MEMQGYQRVENLPTPYHLTTKDRLVLADQGVDRAWKVLFVRPDHVVLAQFGTPPNKIVKINWPHVKVAPEMVGVELYRPDGAHIPTERVVSDAPVAEKAKRGRAATGESKIAKCKAFYAMQKGKLTREQIQQAFVDDFGCTEQGANTYFLTCQRDWKPEPLAA